jgi:hypothetical protein
VLTRDRGIHILSDKSKEVGVMRYGSYGTGAVIVLTLLFLPSICFAEDIDLVTGLAPEPAASSSIVIDGEKDGDILWDLTHGVYLTYTPSGSFSDLTDLLAAEGFTTSTTDMGVHNIDLTQYDVVVITVTGSWLSAYTAEEVDSLISFTDQGGGLVIMGANEGCPNANINPVSEAFGTTCGIPSSEPSDLYFTNFISHEIFNGISSIFYRATGVLMCIPPSEEAAWSPTYSEVMISLVDPDPRVAVLGTMTGMSNNYFANGDNQAFAINLFAWLAGEQSLDESTWGSIKTSFP